MVVGELPPPLRTDRRRNRAAGTAQDRDLLDLDGIHVGKHGSDSFLDLRNPTYGC
jgi:hypothetical protein